MSPMPMCSCGKSFAVVEFIVVGRILVCEECATRLEQMAIVMGADAKRRPVLGIVPG